MKRRRPVRQGPFLAGRFPPALGGKTVQARRCELCYSTCPAAQSTADGLFHPGKHRVWGQKGLVVGGLFYSHQHMGAKASTARFG